MTQDIRELWELAAKACGYEKPQFHESTGWSVLMSGNRVDWAPHCDDGDGARMEAELGMLVEIDPRPGRGEVYCCVPHGIRTHIPLGVEKFSDHNGDRQAARRMASLRVAAEIGRRMKWR